MHRLRKSAVRKQILSVISYTGIDHLSRPAFGGIGSIVMLHRIAADDRTISPNLTISVTLLDHLIRYVRSLGYEIVTMTEVHRRLHDGDSGRRFVCFTFDDGYLDNYTLALPVFRRHGAPMTVYIATGFLDRSVEYWWGGVEHLVLQNDSISAPIGGRSTVLALRTFAEKRVVFDILVQQAHADMAGFRPVLDELFRRYGVDPRDALDKDALTIDQARAFAADPLVEIGAHGLSHRPLSQLQLSEARQEMTESRSLLERCLDTSVRHFAYPYGTRAECGMREFALAQEAGYVTAVTTRTGNVFAAHRKYAWCLPRLAIDAEWQRKRVARLHLSGAVAAVKYRSWMAI